MVQEQVGGCWLVDGMMVVEQVGIFACGWKDCCGAGGRVLAGGRKDGCEASRNIGWWIEGWLWRKWEYWLVDGRMIVEQVGILAG